jgi:hypothetical protein
MNCWIRWLAAYFLGLLMVPGVHPQSTGGAQKAWSGATKTYLSDSNTDWGQYVKPYLDEDQERGPIIFGPLVAQIGIEDAVKNAGVGEEIKRLEPLPG